MTNKLKHRLKNLVKTKRMFSFLLVLLLTLNIVPNKVKALNIYSESDIKQVVYSNMSKVTTNVTSFSDQRGVFRNLKNITLSGLWIDYLHTNSEVSFSDIEKNNYYSIHKKKISDFNSKFKDKTGEKYIHLQLPVPSDTYSKDEYVTLVSNSMGYLDAYFNKILGEYNSKDTEGKKIFLTDNRLQITSAYEVMLRLDQEYSFMRGLTSKVDNPDLYYVDLSSVSNLLKKDDYQIFYKKAVEELEGYKCYKQD